MRAPRSWQASRCGGLGAPRCLLLLGGPPAAAGSTAATAAAAAATGATSLLSFRRTAPLLAHPNPSCLQDLLPAELAGGRKQQQQGAAAPMRASGSPPRHAPPPAAPAAAAASSTAAPVTVDGLPEAVVDAWFVVADADGDGRVADSEARDFFLTSGLAPADLSKAR